MMKKKIFALVLALVMVLALVPAMAQAGSEQEDVTISKTAMAVEGMVNAWDIELTVNAAAKVNPAPGNDVILVLDNSNSMYEREPYGERQARGQGLPRPAAACGEHGQPRRRGRVQQRGAELSAADGGQGGAREVHRWRGSESERFALHQTEL